MAVFLNPFVRTALRRTPNSPTTWMLAASTGWLLVALGADAVAVIRSGDPEWLAGQVSALVPWYLTGFVVQVLLGALSYLLPVVLGGPPGVGRGTAAVLNRWGPVRVFALNARVLLLALASAGRRAAGLGARCGAVTGFAGLAIAAVMIRKNTV